MICVETNRVIRGDKDDPILKWQVWFQTPFGLCESLHEAVELMKKNEIDPKLSIVPVAVAVTQRTHEVWNR